MKLETITVGRIVGAHGSRGEVRVQPRDGDPAFLTQFSTFLLKGQPVSPTANHVHKSLVLMKFPGVDDMNAALALRDKELYIRRADARLPEGAFFDAELLGILEFLARAEGDRIPPEAGETCLEFFRQLRQRLKKEKALRRAEAAGAADTPAPAAATPAAAEGAAPGTKE